MRPLSFFLLALPATTQLLTTTKPAPQHTAVYTTTLSGSENTPHPLTTVLVTLLTPGEVPSIPFNGAPVIGTAISHFRDAASTWAVTNEVYWTVTGNMDAPASTPIAQEQSLDQTRLTSILTTSSSYTTDIYGPWNTHAHSTIHSTVIKTFIEVIGGSTYPATIVRTGYTFVDTTATGGPVEGDTYTVTATATFKRTTTMVRVENKPTMPAGAVGW